MFTEAVTHLGKPWQSTVQKIIGPADPRTAIVQQAEACQADFIAVGARGLNPVLRLVLGSVSRRVVHASKVPVLVVRSREDANASIGLRVLLACENAKAGRQLTAVIEKFTWPENSACAAISVVPSVLGAAIPDWLKAQTRGPDVEQMIKIWVDEHDAQLSEARRDLQSVESAFPRALRCLLPIVVEGHAGTEIVNQARKLTSDLVVVGAKQSTRLGRLFIGSTCEYVLNNAPCSVLVVHHA